MNIQECGMNEVSRENRVWESEIGKWEWQVWVLVKNYYWRWMSWKTIWTTNDSANILNHIISIHFQASLDSSICANYMHQIHLNRFS